MQLFQFEDVQKALEDYRTLLAEFPQSEFAPKAAFAVAYVYDELLDDSAKATEAYQTVIRDYPESQQAAMAREALGLPPVQRATVRPEDTEVAADTTSLEGSESP